MNSKENTQLFLSNDSRSLQGNNWVIKDVKGSQNIFALQHEYSKDESTNSTSYLRHEKQQENIEEEKTDDNSLLRSYTNHQFMSEIGQVKEDIIRFKTKMNSLAKVLSGIELDLNDSKDRVYEIEKRLIATEEVNVNLHILLERAVFNQKQSDVYATRAMRHIHKNLAIAVCETDTLRGRLIAVAKYQRQHQGSVNDILHRIKEYSHMLEQAHVVIKSLYSTAGNDTILKKNNANKIHHYHHHHYHSHQHHHNNSRNHNHHHMNHSSNPNGGASFTSINKFDLYRHRIIRKKITELNPAQKGLRILLHE